MTQLKKYRVDFWITSGWTQEVVLTPSQYNIPVELQLKKAIENNWDNYGNPYTVRPDMDVDYEIIEEITNE